MNIQLQQAYQDIWNTKNWQFNLVALKASIFRSSRGGWGVSRNYNNHTFVLVIVPTNKKSKLTTDFSEVMNTGRWVFHNYVD